MGPVSILGNISSRAFVQTGDNVVIGGFIVQGTKRRGSLFVRLVLSSRSMAFPIALANPTLELHDAHRSVDCF